MKRLLLTGGTGFFGRALLRHWQSWAPEHRPWSECVVLTRNPSAFLTHYPEFAAGQGLSFHQGDILTPASLPQTGAFCAVLHAATDSTQGPSLTPLQRFEQIVQGTRNVLDWSVHHGVGRLLLTSSGGVYGPQPPHLAKLPETFLGMPDPLEASQAYGVGKRTAEHLCTLYGEAHGIDVVVARCFAFCGPDLPLDVHFAIGNFIRDALWSHEIVVRGDGTPVRSYMDQRDLANWLWALMSRAPGGRAFNVGSDHGITMVDLAHRVRDLLAPRKPVRVMFKPSGDNGRNLYVPDIRRAQTELGLALRISLETSIEDTGRVAMALRTPENVWPFYNQRITQQTKAC
jgi:UDP-glucuronate decarboxylase